MIDQRQIVKKYTENHINKFNEELFTRSDEKLIEELKKVILSCQRNHGFILRVESFTVVDDYEQVYDTLYSYEEMREFRSNRKKKKQLKPKNKKDNPYNFINIKDTDMILLIVKYYIEVKGKAEYVDVIIAVPRFVNKYYFRINGNNYCPQYQIIDTTYNNATSSGNSVHRVIFRNIFMPIRFYKKKYKLTTYHNQEITLNYYISKVFGKMVGTCKFIFAKFGLHNTIDFMGFGRFIHITNEPLYNDDEFYVFTKNNIFINVYKDAFDRDETLQGLIFNLYMSIDKETTFIDFFSNSYWLKSLGKEFGIDTEEKGIELLVSLEGLYDIKTKEVLKLPEDAKKDIYSILLWIMREFSQLMIKDNLNLACKRLRNPEEYIASIYAAKLSTGLIRITNSRRTRLTVDSIKKIVCTLPMYLISNVSKCNLVNYRDLVHDLDSMVVLSYSFKDISGISGENKQSIPELMRHIDISHTGRLDLDSSKKSDPGITGALVPTVKLYDGYFSEYSEPMTWKDSYDELIDNYKKINSLKECLVFEEKILGKDNDEELSTVNESISIMDNLIRPIYFVETSSSIVDIYWAMEYSGTIVAGSCCDEECDDNE